MGGFTAQVQSPQTTGGKGNPVSDAQLPPANGTSGNVLPRNVSNPGPAGLTILGSNDAMPQGKGAGGGVGAMAPGTYDPSVAQRRFANTSAPSGASTDVNNPAAPNYNPAAGGPNYQNQGQMPITPTSIRQGKGAGNTGDNNSVMGQYFATQNQQSTTPTNTGLTDEQKMQSYAMVNKKNTITNSATSGQPRIGQPNNYANTVGGWDNASIQPQRSGGKGKGG